jgi:hypothetical protein
VGRGSAGASKAPATGSRGTTADAIAWSRYIWWHPQARANAQQRVYEPSTGVQQMFAVVEHQQQAPLS